jgi:TonB family protein
MIYLICFAALAQAQPQPSIKGGLESFVTSHTVYPAYSLFNCIQGSVQLAFKLNTSGEVVYSEIRNGMGIDLDDEALRLIRITSGKWTVPKDYDTALVNVVPVNFRISGRGCETKTNTEIQMAIASYQADQGMTNAVLNFYKNKEKGKTTDAEETKIVALKQELGYNDEYFRERIEQGMVKLKQKDSQGACEDFRFVKYMGSSLADEQLAKYCK